MSTVEDMAQAAKLAYGDVNQAAYAVGKGAYQRAQNAGMRYQNWRHKGAGAEPESTPEAVPATNGGKPGGKNWSTEDYEQTTYYSHTSYKRKG